MSQNDVLLEVHDLKKYYPVKGKKGACVKALDGVSLTLHRGEILGVVGESGCGKSTLGRCVMNLIPVTSGSVVFDGTEIAHVPESRMKDIRPHMQMVFQNPFSSFNPKHTIGWSLREVSRHFGKNRQETDSWISSMLEKIGLDHDALSRLPGELSGGQLQRLAIARALIPDPDFIMADEPVSALDVSIQAQILNLLLDLRNELNVAIMFVSHELTVVEHVSDNVMVMYLGAVMESGSSGDLFLHPTHPYTRALLSSKPPERPGERADRIILKGDVPSALDIPPYCRFCTRCPDCVAGLCDAAVPPVVEVEPGHKVACHLAKPLRQ